MRETVEMADLQEIEEAESLVEAVYVLSPTKELQPAAQNSVKDQLLSRALPPYVPPAAPNQQYSPEQFFSCKDCDDKFLLESSLLRHIERRSVTISYGCRTCARTVSFYNRCALLAHLRGHSTECDDDTSPESINISQEKMSLGPVATTNDDDDSGKNDDVEVEADGVSLSPLPKNKIVLGPFIPMPMDDCGRVIRDGSGQKSKSQESLLNVASDENEPSSAGDGSSNDDNQSLGSKENDHQSQAIGNKSASHFVSILRNSVPKENGILLKTKDSNQELGNGLQVRSPDISTANDSTFDNELPGSSECKECGIVPQSAEMKDHFLCLNLPIDMQFKCKTCNLILPSYCSFSAHKRVHMQMKPYICPECSREFGLWASLSVHLLYTCFHMFKSVRYRCIQCKCLFPTAVSLEVHLLTKHVKHVYKCNACPIACFSVKALQDHKVNIHGQSSLPTHSYQQCQLCPDRLVPKSRLLFHVNEHSKDHSVRIYVYQCSDCSFFAQKKTDFAAHRATCSRSGKVKVTPAPSALTPDKVLAAHKIVFPPDNKPVNNCVKIVYTVPSNQMQIALLPKSVKAVKRVLLPQPQQRKLLPKIAVEQNNLLSSSTHVSNIEGNIISKESNNSLAAENKIMPIDGDERQTDSCDQADGKKYIYMSEKKCEANAGDAEVVISTMVSDSRVVEKISLNLENMDNTSSDTSATKPTNILRVCSICRKELMVLPQALGTFNFPAVCSNCAKEHAFVKKDGKLLLVPRDKIVSSEKIDIKNTNGRIELTSKIEDGEKTLSHKNKLNFKRTANSIALNGPTNVKKLKASAGVCLENNKYRCHLCKTLISMDWFKIQEHFSANHPNFKLLVLSPKVNKLKLNCTNVTVPFVVKDRRVYPKIMCVKKGTTEADIANIRQINGNDGYDHVTEDCELNEICIKKEFNNTDNEKYIDPEKGELNENVCDIKKECDIDHDLVPSKIKRKKKTSQKSSDREGGFGTPFSSGQVVSALQQVSASGLKYECSKCHYADSSAESFREHIILHRTDENEFQCMECGMCFVVKPSFEKHLFINHRIKDSEVYLQNNNCCGSSEKDEEKEETSPQKESSPPSEEDLPPDLVENQCRVCREIFDTAFQLSKHFRTHGMAFLLMKKRGNKVS